MPADILSLSKARKAKARTLKEQQAQQNRAVFGQTKAEKALKKAQDDMARHQIDAHKLGTTQDE
jgi:Domain of unknown function (DUF4169)